MPNGVCNGFLSKAGASLTGEEASRLYRNKERTLKEMIDVVDKVYPVAYIQLIDSDPSEAKFEAEITRMYNQIRQDERKLILLHTNDGKPALWMWAILIGLLTLAFSFGFGVGYAFMWLVLT